MIEKSGNEGDNRLVGRIRSYRALVAMDGVSARAQLVRGYRGYLAAFRRNGDAVAARGALRLLGYAALDLAILPCVDRREAAAKVARLEEAAAWLHDPAADAHLRRMGAMVAAAASAERGRWSAPTTAGAAGATDYVRGPAAVDPAQRWRCVASSEPVTLGEALHGVADAVGDHASLLNGTDEVAVAGAAIAIRCFATYCMASPIVSLQGLRDKSSMLAILRPALVPARLFRRPFEVALASDCDLARASAVESAQALGALPFED